MLRSRSVRALKSTFYHHRESANESVFETKAFDEVNPEETADSFVFVMFVCDSSLALYYNPPSAQTHADMRCIVILCRSVKTCRV